MNVIKLEDINSERLKTIGIIFILHSEIQVSSFEDYQNVDLGLKSMNFVVSYANGVASESASI